MGMITPEMTSEEALKELKSVAKYDSVDFVHQVSTDKPYEWQPGKPVIASRSSEPSASCHSEGTRRLKNLAPSLSLRAKALSVAKGQRSNLHIVVIDLGLKYNILRTLNQFGCQVTVVPCDTSVEGILKLKPDGIVLSSGPGNPVLLDYIAGTIKALLGKKPIMGIGLGQNLMGQAFGAKSFKLKFGHHGSYPVRDLATHRVYITAQNHGYAIDADTLKGGLEGSHINLNDGTVEGLRHRDLPLLSVQYHPEASPGPQDNMYLFERFLDMVEINKAALKCKM